MAVNDPIIDVKEIVARYTNDVIGVCAFGLECNNLKEQEKTTEFRLYCDKAFQQPRHCKTIDHLISTFPKWAKGLGIRFIHEDVHQFFMRVVRETIDYREKNSIRRNDFMNLLIDLKNSENGLTIEEIAAQSFVFFLAGYETSSSTMGFALFELALNQDIQDKLRAEINEQYDKNGGTLTYGSMVEMHYMEMVIRETLRKYCVVPHLMRRALNHYHTSENKYVIPKEALVLIPSDAIHRDPEIYPNPEEFNPERFTSAEMKKRHPLTHMPFGIGPRNCIGLRFAKIQILIGIGVLLKHFKFYHCEKTLNPLPSNNSSMFLSAKGGILLRVERIDKKL